jgi:hypothetical protein
VANSKSEITVDLDVPTVSLLKAETYLFRRKANTSFHEILDCRHHLGIYNVSAGRILKKLTTFCSGLEECLVVAPRFAHLHEHQLKQEEVDYIELYPYAAAEHIGDLDLIVRCFFNDNRSAARSPILGC